MNQLLINQFPLTYPDTPIKIYIKFGKQKGIFKLIKYLTSVINNNELLEYLKENISDNEFVSFQFNKDNDEWKEIEIDLSQDTFFIPYFLSSKLGSYFKSKGMSVSHSFIGDLEVWEPKFTSTNYEEFNVWNLKIERMFGQYYITVGLNSQNSRILNKSVSENKIDPNIINKILVEQEILKTKNFNITEINQYRPVVNRYIGNLLNLNHKNAINKFSFANHFQLIAAFYETYLKGITIDSKIQILESGFRELNESETFQINRSVSLLEFGNSKTEYDPYRGISNYGPYFVPEEVNKVKFLFIYSKNDRDNANSLYKYFKYGYRHFPGLESFVKIPFDIDIENSIRFENTSNPFDEINSKIQKLSLDKNSKYVAIYISPISEDTANEDEKIIYFKIKEALLKQNITSQVIENIKLKSQSVHFYLPNMSIAILAKVGGIPWKLKRELGNCLLIGFGENKMTTEKNISYVGNTVCFDNSGIFKDLRSFEYKLSNLGTSIENAINSHLKSNGVPQKLIIHYFKNWGGKESNEIHRVFKKLNLSIPYVVLNINDTRAKLYMCFDPNYPGKIPLSGTVTTLKKNEFLLFNNERYSKDISNFKGSDNYPVKITITAHKGIDISDKLEIQELLFQVYEFSNLYWRSVKQKAIPVTIEYAKELSEKAFYFENSKLPNTEIATKTLWFI